MAYKQNIFFHWFRLHMLFYTGYSTLNHVPSRRFGGNVRRESMQRFTAARTNTNVPRISARLPLHGSLVLGAQNGKLDADLRTSPLLGTPSVQSIHDYYPFAVEDGGRLAQMATELVDRLAILVVVRRFPGMGAADSRSLRSDSYARMQHFVRRSTYVKFRRFLGDVRREFMQRLSAALHGTLGSYLCDAFQEGSVNNVACLPVPRA
jgi:hypothetical protein